MTTSVVMAIAGIGTRVVVIPAAEPGYRYFWNDVHVPVAGAIIENSRTQRTVIFRTQCVENSVRSEPANDFPLQFNRVRAGETRELQSLRTDATEGGHKY